MPFTPFHWGPALLMGLLLFPIFDMPALLISSVIPDVEPLSVLMFGLFLPLHGFFHSYLGVSILGVLVAVALYPLRGLFNRIMAAFRLPQKSSSFKKLLSTSLLGVYSHVFLDSFLYGEMMPFYPLEGNPFLGVVSSPPYTDSVRSPFSWVSSYISLELLGHRNVKPRICHDFILGAH